jgi:hypothetical protein
LDGTSPPLKRLLLDLCAAALNQNGQYDDNQHTSYNPNDHGTVHKNSSFLFSCYNLLDALSV